MIQDDFCLGKDVFEEIIYHIHRSIVEDNQVVFLGEMLSILRCVVIEESDFNNILIIESVSHMDISG